MTRLILTSTSMVNDLKLQTLYSILFLPIKILLFMQLFHIILSRMANSVDPDQTAPSDLGLHCLHIAFCQEIWCSELGHLSYNMHFVGCECLCQAWQLKM